MRAITTRKEGVGKYGPRYRVLVHGRPTPFAIEKSIPPKYRAPQMWDVIEGEDPDAILFDSSSLNGAVGVFQAMYDALAAHIQANQAP